MSDTLREIARRTVLRVAAWKREMTAEARLALPLGQRLPRDFVAPFRLAGPGVGIADRGGGREPPGKISPPARPQVIAEVKLASPSQGTIAQSADPVAVAQEYLRAGAAALSVLTEPDFFHGRPEYLVRIREACPDALLLMKDFVVDEYQLALARSWGADCVLLIVALLGSETRRYLESARRLGLSVLVEVHDEAELTIALETGAELIGVNNRDLRTLKISLEQSRRLAAHLPAGRNWICESGLETGADLAEMQALGCRGFLIGTSLMRTGDPGNALRELLRAVAEVSHA